MKIKIRGKEINLKKHHFNIKYLHGAKYLKILENQRIDENSILIESGCGRTLHGNLFYILQELKNNDDYKNYKIKVAVDVKHIKEFQLLLKHYGLKVELVKMYTNSYYRILSSAKYIFVDSSHIVPFIKKQGQVIINTWHGTPLKCMGKSDNSGFLRIGNVQKSLVVADYLLFKNQYSKDIMIRDYMLENIAQAKCLLAGYPRNEIFFKGKNKELINVLNLQGKEVIAYMPTWRGSIGDINMSQESEELKKHLDQFSRGLKENQVLMVKLHPFVMADIKIEEYGNIIEFPKEYECYEVLNVADQLITDYSSVIFDFVCTKRKIILFDYDELYLRDRGVYIPLEELPFARGKSVVSVMNAINQPKNYDEQNFIKEYCHFDSKDSSRMLLEHILLHRNVLKENQVPNNGKKNVLIHAGNLAKNGITTSLLNLLHEVDKGKYNYYISFSAKSVTSNSHILQALPQGVGYLPTWGYANMAWWQHLFVIFMTLTQVSFKYKKRWQEKIYRYEIERVYGDIEFSHAVQFSGYSIKPQLMYACMDCDRIIYVHNNMVEEIKSRKNQNPNVLRYAYNEYDKVAIVTEDMRQPTMEFCDDEKKIRVAKNIIDFKNIIRRSKQELVLDKETESGTTIEELQYILDGPKKVFINVARFSVEKGQHRLIDAFMKLKKNNPDIHLILLGGNGPLFVEIAKYIAEINAEEDITIIRGMSNPYPLIRRCDYFVLSSFYEGFGLVLVEADILGVPVISTDVPGPKGFMRESGGCLVANNQEGIFEGMRTMLEEGMPLLKVDYDEYNRDAVSAFEAMLE